MQNSFPPAWITPVPEGAKSQRAQQIIAFISAFGMQTKDTIAGDAGGQLVLRDWQKQLIRHVFAEDEDGHLLARTALIGMPRKNGKSALGSALALWSLFLGDDGGEVYSCAAEKEQARIVFGDAKRMIEAHPDLAGMTKIYRDAIEVIETGSIYRVLSSEAYSKEGLSPTFVVFDELHASPNRDLYDVMQLGMGARKEPMLLSITTAGVKVDSSGRDSIAYELYQYGQRVARGEVVDPSFSMAWWEAPADADHYAPETWRIANPGFGDLNSEKDFEATVRKTPESEFRTKRCNQWVNSQESWLPTGAWENCTGEFEISPDDEIILGFDGSFSGDATVVVGAIVPKEDEPVRLFMVKSWEKDLNIHSDDWRVDISEVEDTIIQFCAQHPRVREIACDPYRWQRSMEVLANQYGLPIVEYPSSSPARMVPACAKFYDAVMDGKLQHDGDGTIARHLSNAVIKRDRLGPRIVKEARNSPRKIDAAVASVIAVDRALVGRIEELVPQIYV